MKSGLEIFLERNHLSKYGKFGLLCNQASILPDFTLAPVALKEKLGDSLVCLFSPQHGLHSTVQDNMIETGDGRFQGLPVYSLYSETREPTEKMLAGIDTILVDLQITGCRVYTYKWTMAAILRQAKKCHKRVVVLDRPNPLGLSLLEGRALEEDSFSFVGEAKIPMRHGLTMGELALFLGKTYPEAAAELEVVKMETKGAEELWAYHERPWVITSPNLPTYDSVLLYPGTVIFEGTNISEGRGTTLPFQFVGAPYLKELGFRGLTEMVERIHGDAGSRGYVLRPTEFQPTSGKWAGMACHGYQIHITDAQELRPFALALGILRAFSEFDGFAWKTPPYEYEYKRPPIDLIIGCKNAESAMRRHSPRDSFWKEGIADFIAKSESSLLYQRMRYAD